MAVGGDGEAEVFVVFLLLGAGVLDNLLDDIKSHERLAAEEVHLQIVAIAGIFEQIVLICLFAHLRGHQLALAAKIAGGGKAVGARRLQSCATFRHMALIGAETIMSANCS